MPSASRSYPLRIDIMRFNFIALLFFFSPLSSLAQVITGTWSAADTTGFTRRQIMASCVLDDKIYTFGRNLLQNEDSIIEVFDPVSNSWSKILNSEYNSNWGWGAFEYRRKFYFLGDSGKIVEYDPLTNTHLRLPTKGAFKHSGAVQFLNNKIFVFGGDSILTDKHIEYKTIEVFDFSDSTWHEITPSGSFFTRFYWMSTTVNGKIYIFGGDLMPSSEKNISIVDIYDPITNTWSTLDLNTSCSYHNGGSICVLNGKICVLGGFGVTSGPSDNFDIFDPISNSWSMPITSGRFTPRGGITTAVVNNKIYAIGGIQCDVIYPGTDCLVNINEVFSLDVNEVQISPTSSLVKIYPNPSHGIYTVEAPEQPFVNVSITNILGEILMQSSQPTENIEIDLSKYPAGVYNIHCFTKNSVVSEKLVKY
jgi:N-acetylneuraminic acid mutarotase